jgi:AcrR family transcriptional regulator
MRTLQKADMGGKPMPRGRTKGDHGIKRVQIAEAACRVFLRLGIGRTSLADIASELGYTTGVLRHYFSDKDELLLYAKNMLFDRSHERAKAVASGLEGIEKFRAMALELLPSDTDSISNYRLLAMFNGSAVGDERLMKLQHQRNDRHATLFGKVIADLQKEGTLPSHLDAKFEASCVLALIDGLGEQQIMRPKPWPAEALKSVVSRHIDCLFRSPRAGHRN